MLLAFDQDLLNRLEEAEVRLDGWIAEGRSLELCDELSDLCLLAALAKEFRSAIASGDSGLVEELGRKARAALIPKTDDDRCGALLVFSVEGRLAGNLKSMYIRFAESMHCSAASVKFGDGAEGLCIRKGDLDFAVYQHLKHESGVHCDGDERCMVAALPLRDDVSSDGYSFEQFSHPDDRKFHRFRSCVKVSRDGASCESLSQNSAVRNRDLALYALAARLKNSLQSFKTIRNYDFSCGTLTDHRLEKCFSTDDLLPLFESLLPAE